MIDENQSSGRYFVPEDDERTAIAPVSATPRSAGDPAEHQVVRNRPTRPERSGWPLVVGPIGSGSATLGALGVLAGAPPAVSWAVVVVGLGLAGAALVEAYR